MIVLALCTANRCRSQMFEAIFNYLSKGELTAISAGTKATFVHPLATRVLEEIDISTSGQKSKKIIQIEPAKNVLLLEDQDANFHKIDLDKILHVITLCGGANEKCPIFPANVSRIHWPIDDPDQYKGSDDEMLPHFRASRDDIYQRIEKFLK